jgi:hypothetical protein
VWVGPGRRRRGWSERAATGETGSRCPSSRRRACGGEGREEGGRGRVKVADVEVRRERGTTTAKVAGVGVGREGCAVPLAPVAVPSPSLVFAVRACGLRAPLAPQTRSSSAPRGTTGVILAHPLIPPSSALASPVVVRDWVLLASPGRPIHAPDHRPARRTVPSMRGRPRGRDPAHGAKSAPGCGAGVAPATGGGAGGGGGRAGCGWGGGGAGVGAGGAVGRRMLSSCRDLVVCAGHAPTAAQVSACGEGSECGRECRMVGGGTGPARRPAASGVCRRRRGLAQCVAGRVGSLERLSTAGDGMGGEGRGRAGGWGVGGAACAAV